MCFHSLEMEAKMFKHLPGYEEVVLWSSLAQKSHWLLQENSWLLTVQTVLEMNLWGSMGKSVVFTVNCRRKIH